MKRGFSLIELLVVMAVIAGLAAVVVPAFNSIGSGQQFTRAVYEVAGILEVARSEAVARQTYVWVGFEEVDHGGSAELRVGMVASKDGTATNTDAANLTGLVRVTSVQDAKLTDWSDLSSETRSLFEAGTPESLASNQNGISFRIGNQEFSGKTVTFSPRGEVLLEGTPGPDDGFTPFVDLSFRKARSGAEGDDAAVVLDGGTGVVQLLRKP